MPLTNIRVSAVNVVNERCQRHYMGQSPKWLAHAMAGSNFEPTNTDQPFQPLLHLDSTCLRLCALRLLVKAGEVSLP